MIFAKGDRVRVAEGVEFYEGQEGVVERELTSEPGSHAYTVSLECGDTESFGEGHLELVMTATAVAAERFAATQGNVTFITKDSGERDSFATGMVRDAGAGKGRYDLLPREAVHRVAQLLERGADKYEARNWELGQPFSRAICSMLRHAFQAAAGMTDEDHLAAVVFNAMAVMTYQDRIARGELPAELDDLPHG